MTSVAVSWLSPFLSGPLLARALMNLRALMRRCCSLRSHNSRNEGSPLLAAPRKTSLIGA
jgi:hypothetical protein